MCLSRVIASPAAGERGVVITILSLPTPPPRRLWKRFALCEALLFLWCAHGGAHCKTACARSKGKANASPLARSLRGVDAFGQGEGYLIGEAPRSPLANGRADGSLTLRVQTVSQCAPPCAHPRRSSGKALGKALPKTGRPRARRGKGERSPLTFPLSVARQWFVKGARFRNRPFAPSG